MDFSLDEHQEALRALTGKICEEQATVERIRGLEASGEWFHRGLWTELARAELLGLAIPPEFGGSGLGIFELCLMLEQIGRTVAPVPLLPTLVMGALPIAEFGTDAQQARLLPPVAAGELILTAAFTEAESDIPNRPNTLARADGSGWRLSGAKICVPAALWAGRILVPARTGPESIGVFLVDPSARGVHLERQVATSREPQGLVTLDEVRVEGQDVLGDPMEGAAIVDWIVERTLVGLCALELGVTEQALAMTAQYTSGRQQFDRPIATFQAVAQRAADAWIDVEALRLTTWSAAWRLSQGLPAAREASIAKFWAAEGGHRAVYACQHLHGGIGVDVDYPIHRYYLWSRQIELTLGGANRHLASLGSQLASSPQ